MHHVAAINVPSRTFGLFVQGTVEQEIVTHLHWLLQRCLLRRLKADVEKGLPPKTETKIFLPLSPMQLDWYRRVLMRDLSALGNGEKKSGSTSVQNIVVHLRKVCNHPYLFDGAEPGPPFIEGEHLITNSGKLVVTDKLLKRLKVRAHPHAHHMYAFRFAKGKPLHRGAMDTTEHLTYPHCSLSRALCCCREHNRRLVAIAYSYSSR